VQGRESLRPEKGPPELTGKLERHLHPISLPLQRTQIDARLMHRPWHMTATAGPKSRSREHPAPWGHVSGRVTARYGQCYGSMIKIPRVYRACYGVTGQMPPGYTGVAHLVITPLGLALRPARNRAGKELDKAIIPDRHGFGGIQPSITARSVTTTMARTPIQGSASFDSADPRASASRPRPWAGFGRLVGPRGGARRVDSLNKAK
jgi:hypothetical protein